jgi:hypothetical protein
MARKELEFFMLGFVCGGGLVAILIRLVHL